MSAVHRDAMTSRGRRAGLPALILAGAMGCGSPTDPPAPEVVVETELTLVLQAISAGRDHTCAIASDGSAYCWGGVSNTDDGSAPGVSGSTDPNIVAGNHLFTNVSACGRRTCAASVDNGAYCWGFVDADIFTSDRPTQVVSPVRFSFVGAGNAHTCGLDEAGQAFCWGVNTNGQLGNGTIIDTEQPAPVSFTDPFTALSVGANHSCGLTAEGDALCWGFNETGQLGNGTAEHRTSPEAVAGGHTWQQLTTGNIHSCGIDVAGEAWCWGHNGSGQLGFGTTDPTSVPVRVDTALRFTDISA